MRIYVTYIQIYAYLFVGLNTHICTLLFTNVHTDLSSSLQSTSPEQKDLFSTSRWPVMYQLGQ